MSRTTLPPRRPSITIDLEQDGFAYRATIGYGHDGRPAELFLDAGKAGSTLDIATRDAAVAVSIALQYGCPIDVLRGAFLREEDGAPAGILARVMDTLKQEGIA